MTASESLTLLLDPIRNDLEVVQGAVRRITTDVGSISRTTQDELRAGLHQLRADVQIAEAELEAAFADDRGAFLDAAREVVAGWRARLDGLRVQARLGSMETRDDVKSALSTVDEALSVADRRLSDASVDARATLETLRAGAEQSLASVLAAGREAIAVIERRTRGTD
jgi:hypothetical protein